MWLKRCGNSVVSVRKDVVSGEESMSRAKGSKRECLGGIMYYIMCEHCMDKAC